MVQTRLLYSGQGKDNFTVIKKSKIQSKDKGICEVGFVDGVVVDKAGDFMCFRKVLPTNDLHSIVSSNISFLTCAAFFRKKCFDDQHLLFDST